MLPHVSLMDLWPSVTQRSWRCVGFNYWCDSSKGGFGMFNIKYGEVNIVVGVGNAAPAGWAGDPTTACYVITVVAAWRSARIPTNCQIPFRGRDLCMLVLFIISSSCVQCSTTWWNQITGHVLVYRRTADILFFHRFSFLFGCFLFVFTDRYIQIRVYFKH